MTTTIRLYGGDLGKEEIKVRCDLTQATAPVQVDYCEGEGWVDCQYRSADAGHRISGLTAIGQKLAARSVEVPSDAFFCECETLGGYVVCYTDGRPDEEYDSLEDACGAVGEEWEDAEIGHDGDLDDGGDRTLVWANEADSINDSGANAVASIRKAVR